MKPPRKPPGPGPRPQAAGDDESTTGAERDDLARADSDPEAHDLTRLLDRWSLGDHGARDTLIRRVLPELRKLAAGQLSRERRRHTLQPTALVNEAFSRLLEQRALRFGCRGQFFAFTGELMRRVLVDHARAHKAKKRGAGQELLPLDEALGFAPEKSDELIWLDQALHDLARFSPEGARVVELRYFVGLTHQEVADALGISRMAARRLWTETKAWLFLQRTSHVPGEEKPP